MTTTPTTMPGSLLLFHISKVPHSNFEPFIIDNINKLDFMSDFSDFVGLLHSEFGPIDRAGEAEDLLDNFRMHDNQKLLKYNVEFQRLAIKTDWDEHALRHQYYVGLPDRIKDILATQPKPRNLIELKAAAHTIDACYWEHQHKKSHSDKLAPTNSDKKVSSSATSASASASLSSV